MCDGNGDDGVDGDKPQPMVGYMDCEGAIRRGTMGVRWSDSSFEVIPNDVEERPAVVLLVW